MNISLRFCNAYCSVSKFIINDVPASYEDFGTKADLNEENAPDFGCGNMQFTPKKPTLEVLKKYSITPQEYVEIAKTLRDNLSFGMCDYCA